MASAQPAGVDWHQVYCSACRDGGHLLCCDGCTSAAHPACIGLGAAPEVRARRSALPAESLLQHAPRSRGAVPG
jgi:hypothetical protein